jgi:Tol biopolymer transport system component
VRQLILTGIVVAALIAILVARPASFQPAGEQPALSYVTTAHQLGVVGYRDPVGAISPDGKHFAYTEGRFLRVVPVAGGSPVTLTPGEGQIRHLTWATNTSIAVEDPTPLGRWWLYELGRPGRTRLWDVSLNNQLRQLACNGNGSGCVALRSTTSGAELVSLSSDVVLHWPIKGRASWPVSHPKARGACIVNARITLPCGGSPLKLDVDRDVYGPIALSPDGNTVYFSMPNASGMVALSSADVRTGRTRLWSNFSRDAYAPSVSSDGRVVFKVQSYRTFIADVAANGGETRQLATFQSETPSYHPTLPRIAFTYGTWRRVIDDAKYPDIAQEIGIIDVSQNTPAATPLEVIAQSDSEDQAMAWSPNGKWIAFHTHREMSDDVWLKPADGKHPDKRITFLGRGAEVGWPRWSPDGRTVLLNGARKRDGASVLYTIGVNQDTGALTSELNEVVVNGVEGEMGHAEWLPYSSSIVAVAKEAPGRHVIFRVGASGGSAIVVHRVDTEHDFSGLGVSPDGKWVAFAAPASDGYFQIFKKEIEAKSAPVQVTSDPSNKTQPAWSPDGQRIAFTVWSYDATFWSFNNR